MFVYRDYPLSFILFTSPLYCTRHRSFHNWHNHQINILLQYIVTGFLIVHPDKRTYDYVKPVTIYWKLDVCWYLLSNQNGHHFIIWPKLSSCGQRRLWSDWADAQADLRWAHTHFVIFIMSRLIYIALYIFINVPKHKYYVVISFSRA